MNSEKPYTQNDETRAVDQDIASYDLTPESLSMLKVLALGREEIDEGKIRPVKKSFSNIRRKINLPS